MPHLPRPLHHSRICPAGDPDTWERQLAAGMLAPMRMVAELAPDMARRGRCALWSQSVLCCDMLAPMRLTATCLSSRACLSLPPQRAVITCTALWDLPNAKTLVPLALPCSWADCFPELGAAGAPSSRRSGILPRRRWRAGRARRLPRRG